VILGKAVSIATIVDQRERECWVVSLDTSDCKERRKLHGRGWVFLEAGLELARPPMERGSLQERATRSDGSRRMERSVSQRRNGTRQTD